MVVSQGDVFWASLPEPFTQSGRPARPVVVIQGDRYNRSNLSSYVVVHLTTSLNRAHIPGCVLLAKGEANLPRRSVANITQINTVREHQLIEKIGTLSTRRLEEIMAGVRLVLRPSRSS